MDRYEKRAMRPLRMMEKHLAELEQRLIQMEISGDRSMHMREQGRAIRDIKKIARQAQKAVNLERKSDKHWMPSAGAGLLQEDEVVASIEREFDKLDERLANLDDYDTALKSYIEQTQTLNEVKSMLHEAGLYRNHIPPAQSQFGAQPMQTIQ